MEELRFKRFAHPPFSLDITASDFFPFVWLKGEFSSRWVSEINGLFEIVEEILSTLRPERIARGFANWIERLKQVLDTSGGYTRRPTQHMQKHLSPGTPCMLG
jgi:hypothetical protein